MSLVWSLTKTFCISAYPDMWMMWIILRANAKNSFCHPSGLKLNPHSANRKLRAGLMPARFFVRIPKVHARAEMHHERAYLHYFAGRKGFVALPSRKVPRFLGSWKENKAFSSSAGMLRPYKGSITYIKKVQSVSLADTGFYISPNNSRKGEMKK